MRVWTCLVVALLLAAVAGAEIPRSAAAVRAFERQSGYPRGRRGYVVDHVIPLCAGGPDTPANMQWQARAASRRKDKFEVALCAAMKRQGLRLVAEAHGGEQ